VRATEGGATTSDIVGACRIGADDEFGMSGAVVARSLSALVTLKSGVEDEATADTTTMTRAEVFEFVTTRTSSSRRAAREVTTRAATAGDAFVGVALGGLEAAGSRARTTTGMFDTKFSGTLSKLETR
jgi:hypothetical protein